MTPGHGPDCNCNMCVGVREMRNSAPEVTTTPEPSPVVLQAPIPVPAPASVRAPSPAYPNGFRPRVGCVCPRCAAARADGIEEIAMDPPEFRDNWRSVYGVSPVSPTPPASPIPAAQITKCPYCDNRMVSATTGPYLSTWTCSKCKTNMQRWIDSPGGEVRMVKLETGL